MQLLSNILLQKTATQVAGMDSTLDKSVLCCWRQIIASYVIIWQLFSHTDIKQCISQMVGNECLTAVTHTTRNRGHGSERSGSIFLALELSVKYFASKYVGNSSIILVENHVWNSRSTGLLLSFWGHFIMLDSLSSTDCFMDWVDVGGVACHSGDLGGESLPIPWRTLVLLQHQKVIINTLNTDNFSVQTKIDASSPEDSAADMTRLKAEYNIFSAKSERRPITSPN